MDKTLKLDLKSQKYPILAVSFDSETEKLKQFQRELFQRVMQYFTSQHLKMRDVPAIYLKIGIILIWTIFSYTMLIFTHGNLIYKLALAISLGLAIIAVNFNMGHDANHSAISDNKFINRFFRKNLRMFMEQDDLKYNLKFTSGGAWLGFLAYCVLASIIATIFLWG